MLVGQMFLWNMSAVERRRGRTKKKKSSGSARCCLFFNVLTAEDEAKLDAFFFQPPPKGINERLIGVHGRLPPSQTSSPFVACEASTMYGLDIILGV